MSMLIMIFFLTFFIEKHCRAIDRKGMSCSRIKQNFTNALLNFSPLFTVLYQEEEGEGLGELGEIWRKTHLNVLHSQSQVSHIQLK